jgi:hypothetical protein
MLTTPVVPLVLVAVAVIFIVLVVRDYLQSEGKLSPARKTWLRIALVFAIVGIGLFVVNAYLA